MSLRIFVYEYLSGGGEAPTGPAAFQAADRAADRPAFDPDAAPSASSVEGAERPSLNGATEADAAELLVSGLAMRDAMVADLAALPGVSVSFACASPDVRFGPTGAQVRPVYPMDGETATAFVQREAALHDAAWVVAPETDALLSQLAAVVAPAKWIGCEPSALELCSRKRATIAHLAAHGLLTPLAFDAQATCWVVKPDDGAGCLHTRRHDTRVAAQADLHARRTRGESATLEPWVDGVAMSISLVCGGAEGAQLISINRQQIEVQRDGTLHDAGVLIGGLDAAAPGSDLLVDDAAGPAIEQDADLQANTAQATAADATTLHGLAHQIGQALPGLRGFVGVDLVWHPTRGPVVIEVNPRVTCAYLGLSSRLGRNLAADVLQRHGLPVETAAPTAVTLETTADAAS